jgi:hypothetical protein
VTTVEAPEEADELVGIAIPGDMASLALMAADGFRKMPGIELAKFESMMRADLRGKKPTAKNVGDICRIVGFMFAMEINAARDKRMQEKANADSSTAEDP